jgi:hypothetical protein
MQHDNNKSLIFQRAVGEVIKEMIDSTDKSISLFAREYDFDRGNLSRAIRGNVGCRLINAWKLAEASKIDFVEFAHRLKNKLGEDFKLIDE